MNLFISGLLKTFENVRKIISAQFLACVDVDGDHEINELQMVLI